MNVPSWRVKSYSLLDHVLLATCSTVACNTVQERVKNFLESPCSGRHFLSTSGKTHSAKSVDGQYKINILLSKQIQNIFQSQLSCSR